MGGRVAYVSSIDSQPGCAVRNRKRAGHHAQCTQATVVLNPEGRYCAGASEQQVEVVAAGTEGEVNRLARDSEERGLAVDDLYRAIGAEAIAGNSAAAEVRSVRISLILGDDDPARVCLLVGNRPADNAQSPARRHRI